ncbi:MAG: serine/threonine protein kinase [Proteobacteria bacterium]|nr:serine/threonine protein kinase [Pseudomonadota bacterium]
MAHHYCSRCLTTFQGTPTNCPNLSCGKKPPGEGWGQVLGAGDLLDRHYKIDKVLAIGGAGLTYLAQEEDASGQPSGPRLAIKVLYSQRDAGPFLRRLSNEAQILQDLDHAHIVKCRGFVHRTGHPPYLVTLFEEGGALTDFVEDAGGLSPRVAAGVLKQILLALDIAHQRGVVHRDLKPDNVLLHKRVEPAEIPLVRVADFGIAKIFGGVGDRLTRLGSFIGTPEYAAPEQFEGVSPTPATDVFAAGGLLYYLVTGQPPVVFKHRNDIAASHDELLQQLPPQLPTAQADSMEIGALQEIINWTMTLRPGDRWTVQQVLAQLNQVLEGKVPHANFTDQGAPKRVNSPSTASSFKPGDLATKGLNTLEGPDGKTLSGPMSPVNSDHGQPAEPWDPRTDAPPVPSKAARTGPPPPPEPPVRAPQQTEWTQASSPSSPPSKGPPPPPPAQTSPPPLPPEPTPLPPPPPSATPPPAPVSRPTPAVAASPEKKRGKGGLLAAGGAVFMAGGAVVVLLIAGIAAWQLGVFGGAGPVDFAAPAHAAEKQAITDAVAKSGADIGKLCGAKGAAKAQLTIGGDGRVTAAAVDPTSVAADKIDCVSKALGKIAVPRTTSGEGSLRVSVPLD